MRRGEKASTIGLSTGFRESIKNTSSKAADGLGKAGKWFFGKISRSGNSNVREEEPVNPRNRSADRQVSRREGGSSVALGLRRGSFLAPDNSIPKARPASKKRDLDEWLASSSDAPLFSSDDLLASSSDLYLNEHSLAPEDRQHMCY